MGSETPLRVAGPADAATVAGLIGDFRDSLESNSPANAAIEAVVSKLIGDRGTECLLIGGPEAGFAQIHYRLSVWKDGEDTWLEDAFVRKENRRRGYGRTLVKAAIERARTRGCGRDLGIAGHRPGAVARPRFGELPLEVLPAEARVALNPISARRRGKVPQATASVQRGIRPRGSHACP